MIEVTIRCPSTKQWLPIGTGADSQAAYESKVFSGSVRCPHCDDLHYYFGKDTRYGYPVEQDGGPFKY